MKTSAVKNKKGLLKLWRILVLVLLNILIIAAILYPFGPTETVQTLSRNGSRGNEVRQIQSKLRELGLYNGSVDGIYGSVTEKAVKAFQKQCGLKVDGIAGPVTLKYLGLEGSTGNSSGGYSSSDYELLSRTISAEARGESYTGQVAVGAVILNRVKHSSFPDSIPGVIYQPGAFSCLNDSNWSQPVVDSARRAARDALNGSDPSGGAIYYYNPATAKSKWITTRPVTTYIGSHIFCR